MLESLLEEAREEDGADAGIAVSGAIAGMVAELVMHPLDTLSHRAKVHPTGKYGSFWGSARNIVREEGIRAVWAGWKVTALVAGPSSAVYFGVYHVLRNSMLPYSTSRTQENLIFLGCGAVAELHATALFVPFDIVRCRLQLGSNPRRATGGVLERERPYSSISASMKDIVRAEGWRGLYSGAGTVVVLECALTALQFAFYENIRWSLRKRFGDEYHTPIGFVAGGSAGFLAAIATNPLDTVVSRLMAQGRNRRFGTGPIAVFRSCLNEGWPALWRGTLSRAMAIAPMNAIQFGVFDILRGILT